MNWIKKHFKQIIYISFLFPIILVAFVSISHVTKWYAIGNPISWAIYLSVAVEVAALSSLAAIVAKMGKKVYFPFLLVTFIQLLGNVFFSYQYIKLDNQVFLDWVELVNPLFSLWVEPTDLIAHKRIASFLLGGLLPVISLTFLGLLVKFEETDWGDEKNEYKETEQPITPSINIDEIPSSITEESTQSINSEGQSPNEHPEDKDTVPYLSPEFLENYRKSGLSDEEIMNDTLDEMEGTGKFNIFSDDYDEETDKEENEILDAYTDPPFINLETKTIEPEVLTTDTTNEEVDEIFKGQMESQNETLFESDNKPEPIATEDIILDENTPKEKTEDEVKKKS